MSALSEFKAAMRPGVEIDVTNHYITRTDHAKFGTTRRRVVKTNTASYYTDGDPYPMQWPKASMIGRDPGGVWHIDYPERPGVQFLSIKVVQS